MAVMEQSYQVMDYLVQVCGNGLVMLKDVVEDVMGRVHVAFLSGNYL